MNDRKKPKPMDILRHAGSYGETVAIDLWYPRIEGNYKYLEVGICDVRAADSIRVSYDFDRDGYKIEQASIFDWEPGDKVQDSDWQEVAFIEAWGRTDWDTLRK